MSGSTIGGVVGFAVGSMFGMPQVGFMLGSAIGGYLDPEVIEGPRLNDAQVQTSAEGVPRPIVYGTAVVAGNVIQRGPLVHTTTRERQGKGGPVVKEHHYSMSYAIRVCEGPIAGIRRIWADDKVIYDARTDAAIEEHYSISSTADLIRYMAERVAMSAATASGMRVYLGDETQLPDPTLEGLPAIFGGGVGNVPAYRGSAYVVFTNKDLTERRGTIPQYRFEVVSVGTTGTAEGEISPLLFASESSPWQSNAAELKDPRRPGVTYRYQYGGGVVRDTLEDAVADAVAAGRVITGSLVLRGWTNYTTAFGVDEAHDMAPWDVSLPDTGYSFLTLVYSRYPADIEDGDGIISGASFAFPFTACSLLTEATWGRFTSGSDGSRFQSGVVVSSPTPLTGYTQAITCSTTDGSGVSAGNFYYFDDISIQCIAELTCGGASSDWLAIPDAEGQYFDPVTREIISDSGCSEVSGSYRQLQAFSDILATGEIISLPVGPVLSSTHPQYNDQAFWEAAYAQGLIDGTVNPGRPYNPTAGGYPDTVFTACECADIQTITPGSVQLWEVVTDLCARVGVDASYLEVSDLTQEVRGLVIGRQMACAEAIRSTQPCYFWDFVEWGDYTDDTTLLRGVNRGGPSLFTITDDDLIDSDDDEEVRAQALEFPRKVNVISADVEADYAPTKQTAERRTTSVRAVGEMTMEIPIATSRDEAAQIADKSIKIAWAKAEGRMERQLPEEFHKATPSDPFTYDDKRWIVDRAEYMDGIVKIEASRDRISAYTSNATAGAAQGPAFHGSTLRGATMCEVLNVSLLDESRDQLGVYVAVCGHAEGYLGSEVRFELAGEQFASVTITTPSGIGTTTTALSAGSRYAYDEDATVTVNLFGAEPEDATWAQLLAEANACVIGDEVMQFADALDNGDGTWTLTGLMSGRLDSTPAAHAVGTRFVLLNAPVFVPFPSSAIGQEVTVHPISIGTAAEDNPTTTFEFTPARTQSEWAPYMLTSTRDGSNNVAIRFIGRGRLGTSAAPYHSTYFDGYRITYTSGATSVVYVTATQSHAYTAAQQTLDFGSPPVSLDVSIVALNRITGASAALTGTV